MPIIPSRLPQIRRPSIHVGDQPFHPPPSMLSNPSVRRREIAIISPRVMSAVSSVKTLGVLVTAMPLRAAAVTSILSTPLPKLAISLRLGPAWPINPSSIRSVTVGTSTSIFLIAAASWAWLIGLSSRLSVVSKSSRIRVSTASGSLRVTSTDGFLRDIGFPGPILLLLTVGVDQALTSRGETPSLPMCVADRLPR